MSEFIPFEPFSSNFLRQYSQSIFDQTVEKNQKEDIPNPSQLYQSNQSQNKIKQSPNHNLVKQLIITTKQMMKPHIKNICIGILKETIQQIWSLFVNNKKPSKQMLKAFFDADPKDKLLQKYSLAKVMIKHGKQKYKQAIDQIKHQILSHMKLQNIKAHLINRKIKNKQRFTAFITYFLHEELLKGKIACRQTEKAGERINQIIEKVRQQQMFMECLLQDQEVNERFASLNNETS